MEISEIQNEVEELAGVAMEKGWRDGRASIWVKSGGIFTTVIEGEHPTLPGYGNNLFLHGDSDTIEGAVEAGKQLAAKVDDVSLHEHKAALRRIGETIDYCKDIGLDVEFLNPLIAAMESLSENILTKG